jgi:hypothetical protein
MLKLSETSYSAAIGLTLKLTHVVAVVETAESASAENNQTFIKSSVFSHALCPVS